MQNWKYNSKTKNITGNSETKYNSDAQQEKKEENHHNSKFRKITMQKAQQQNQKKTQQNQHLNSKSRNTTENLNHNDKLRKSAANPKAQQEIQKHNCKFKNTLTKNWKGRSFNADWSWSMMTVKSIINGTYYYCYTNSYLT